LKECGWKQLSALRHDPDIFMEGFRKASRKLMQGSSPPGQDFNPGPDECDVQVLTVF
jgi:hypothetical protein